MADITVDDFRAECLAFLEANASPKAEATAFVWGEGPDDAALFEEVDRDAERAELAEAKAWRARRFDAGLGWITGDPELGGRGLTRRHEQVYNEVESRFDVPDQGFFGIGLGMVAPTIADHATPAVAADLLPKLYRGDLVGCQLFSEPGAGSDLASLQMRAERDGDEWLVSGQKVWTSGAHYSDIGEVICRTDPDLPKHKGLTGFVVDMQAPGVEVRPLRQMTGGANFNEVFFNEVRVPDTHRLGDVNDGWRVALTTLMNERASIGTGSGGGGSGGFTRLREMVRHFGLADDPLVRQELMDLYIRHKILGYSNQRAIAAMKRGELPGPEMSGGKLWLTENMRRTSAFVSRVLGPRLAADSGEWGTYSWASYVLGMPAMAIAGGSDQVLRNIMGERVLGLPKEPGIDTTSPFKDLLVGTQRHERLSADRPGSGGVDGRAPARVDRAGDGRQARLHPTVAQPHRRADRDRHQDGAQPRRSAEEQPEPDPRQLESRADHRHRPAEARGGGGGQQVTGTGAQPGADHRPGTQADHQHTDQVGPDDQCGAPGSEHPETIGPRRRRHRRQQPGHHVAGGTGHRPDQQWSGHRPRPRSAAQAGRQQPQGGGHQPQGRGVGQAEAGRQPGDHHVERPGPEPTGQGGGDPEADQPRTGTEQPEPHREPGRTGAGAAELLAGGHRGDGTGA